MPYVIVFIFTILALIVLSPNDVPQNYRKRNINGFAKCVVNTSTPKEADIYYILSHMNNETKNILNNGDFSNYIQ